MTRPTVRLAIAAAALAAAMTPTSALAQRRAPQDAVRPATRPTFDGATTQPVTRPGFRPVTGLSQLDLLEYLGESIDFEMEATPLLTGSVLAKATPDECFLGFGNSIPATDGGCPIGLPKTNEAYVWGMTKAGDQLYFGTGPNILCLVFSSFLGNTEPVFTNSYVCEFGEQSFSPQLPAEIGDWRPPSFYRYDTEQGELVDETWQVLAGGPLSADFARYYSTVGIRSAGNANGVVFMGGPGFTGGINLFAFDADSGAYLGSQTLPQFTNIRTWAEVNNTLYAAVKTNQDFPGTLAPGAVVRWTPTENDLFRFVDVGYMDGEAANLAEYNGRLAVTTWPAAFGPGGLIPSVPGLFVSPEISPIGLTPLDVLSWQKVWQTTDYDPDQLTALTYGGGAAASFGGYLYWGTMHVPGVSIAAWDEIYGVAGNGLDAAAAVLGTHRAVSIFRGHFEDGQWVTELVYGEPMLPVYSPGYGWSMRPTGNGAPLFGRSGFGNLLNNYTWSMAVYDGSLFIGTMDFSYILGDAAAGLLGFPPELLTLLGGSFGADLMRIDSPDQPAYAESLNGIGNFTNYGIRTMVADRGGLYLGTANPMNLMTSLTDDLPEGGWELIRLGMPQFTACPADLDHDGIVGPDDLNIVLASLGWSGPPAGHPADLDASGTVDGFDIAIVSASFGVCQPLPEPMRLR